MSATSNPNTNHEVENDDYSEWDDWEDDWEETNKQKVKKFKEHKAQ